MAEKIVLGMSGGVDSSASASMLMSRGYEVHGLFLRYRDADPAPAATAARELGIPLEVRDITCPLEEKVITPFINEYMSGRTPNPCVICNPGVKFRALIEEADRIGAIKVATGHYAVVRDGRLFASPSPKDQSYMLYRLPPEVIARCVFPLGGTEDKAEVRELARRAGLSGSQAPDSMEICFIPDGDHAAFIEGRGFRPKRGSFIDENGNILGPDGGIHRYTIGQRRGLGIASTGRLYVKEIRAGSGDVVLSLNDPVVTRCHMKDMAFTDPEYMDKESFDCLVRVRHSRGFAAGRCFPGRGYIDFEQPVRAVTPGQSAVCYTPDDRQVVCGGFITEGVE